MGPSRRVVLCLLVLLVGGGILLGAGGALAGPTDLDPTLDDDGVALTTAVPAPSAVARDSQGRFVIAGGATVLRLKANGSVDPTFNGGAAQTLATDDIRGLAVGAGDVIFAAGATSGLRGEQIAAVTKLTAAGVPDAAFSGDGTQTTGFPDTAVHEGVAVAADGRIVLAGTRGTGVRSQAYLARLTAAGTPDGTFNPGETAYTGTRSYAAGTAAHAVLVTGTGKPVLAGSNASAAGPTGSGAASFYVARTTTTGAPDAGFAGDGDVNPPTGSGAAAAWAVAAAPPATPSGENALVVGGDAGPDAAVVALRGDGSVSTDFAGTGVSRFQYGTGGAAATLRGLAIVGAQVVAAGTAQGSPTAAGLAKLNAVGTLDTSFAPGAPRPGTKVLQLPGASPMQVSGMVLDGTSPVLVGASAQASSKGVLARVGTPNRAPTLTGKTTPATATAGTPASFGATATDPDADDVVRFEWDFGDGGTATGASVSHTFATPGDRVVRVTVIDSAGAKAEGTALVRVVAPPSAVSASIAVPFGRTLLSDAPFTFTASGAAAPASNGPVTLEWDFGDNAGHAWTDADVDDPSKQPFTPDATGPTVKHAYAKVTGSGSFYSSSSFDDTGKTDTAPGEVRSTYLVRVRATDRFGTQKIVGVPVVVLPDRKPDVSFTTRRYFAAPPGAQTSVLEYGATSFFHSTGSDPDGERDRVVKEDWDLTGDLKPDVSRPAPACANPPTTGKALVAAREAYLSCQAKDPVAFNLFDALRKPAGSPDLTGLNLPYAIPTPYPGDPGSGAFDYQAQFSNANAAAGLVAKRAGDMDAAGVAHSGARPVSLRLTDQSGRSRTVTRLVQFRPRVAPDPVLDVRGANLAKDEQKITDPIVADTKPGKGDGTRVTLELNRSTRDPAGKIAFHVLRIGQPAPPPCPSAEKKGCKGGKDPGVSGVVKTLVVRDEPSVSFTFPAPSPDGKPWSVQDTIYDETGQAGTARYDGFVAVPSTALSCSTVSGQTLGAVAFSGTCVSSNTAQSLFWTAETVDVNGIKLRPRQGEVVLLRSCDKGSIRGVVAQALPTPGSTCPGYTAGAAKPLQLLVNDSPVGELSPADEAKLAKEATFEVTPAGSARYKGFPFSGAVRVETKPGFRSELTFSASFPEAFTADGAKTTKAPVSVPGSNVAKEIIVRRFDGFSLVALLRRRTATARAAQAASQPTIDLKGPITLGGFTVPGVEQLVYDPATGVFDAKARLQLLGKEVAARLVLRNGDLELLDGSVQGDVPLGPNILLKKVRFKVAYLPAANGAKTLQLVASLDFADTTNLVTGTGTLTIEPSPFHVQVAADAQVAVIPARASLDFYGNGVKFHADAGKSFGPASFRASMDGGFASNGFFIKGAGESCLFACLNVKGLISNEAVAACGSIKLLFVNISAGFGYRFKPNDLDVWMGSCDLSSYEPVLDIGPSTRAALTAPPLAPDPALLGGTSFEIPVKPSLAGLAVVASPLVPDPLGRTPKVRLLFAKQGAAPELVGQTSPVLGAFFQVPPNVPGLGAPGVVVDQDTGSGTVRFLVPKPRADGVYVLQALPGQGQFARPAYAYTSPPVTKALFTTRKVEDAPKASAKGALAGTALVFGQAPGTKGLRRIGRIPSGVRATAATSKATMPRVKTAFQSDTEFVRDRTTPSNPADTIPDQYETPRAPARAQLVADEATLASDLTTYESEHLLRVRVAGNLPPGERVQLVERGPYSTSTLGTIIADKKGRFAGTMLFSPIAVESKETHCIDANVLTALQQPRGTVEGLDCFTVRAPPTLNPPKEVKAEVDPKLNVLKLEAGDPYVLGGAPQYVVEITGGGSRQSFPVSADLIASVQAKGAKAVGGKARARAVRGRSSLPSVRRRSWAFKVRLPDAKRVKVRILGVRPRGSRRRVRSVSATLTRQDRRVTLRRRR